MENLALIAARMGSERLPGKVLTEFSGKPSLVHIFNIMIAASKVDEFAVVTTVLKEDDIIEELCNDHDVKVVRGSVHDVLDRFRIACEIFSPKRVIRVTGDDPLMDPGIIDNVIEEHCSGEYDYTSNILERTFPRGMDTEVIEHEALRRAWRTTQDRDDHEHVTLFIRRNPQLFKLLNVSHTGKDYSGIRLCLDTEKDKKLISLIYKELYKNEPIKLTDVLEFLEKNPGLLEINSGIKQKEVKGKVY